jgi:VanZ family protein
MTLAALRPLHFPRLWLGLWLAMLAITLAVCLVPLPRLDLPVSHFDKLEHLLGYAVLSAFAAMLFATTRARVIAAMALLALGVAIEGLQALTPWRSADVLDLLANLLGVACGALVAITPAARTLQALENLVVVRARRGAGR